MLALSLVRMVGCSGNTERTRGRRRRGRRRRNPPCAPGSYAEWSRCLTRCTAPCTGLPARRWCPPPSGSRSRSAPIRPSSTQVRAQAHLLQAIANSYALIDSDARAYFHPARIVVVLWGGSPRGEARAARWCPQPRHPPPSPHAAPPSLCRGAPSSSKLFTVHSSGPWHGLLSLLSGRCCMAELTCWKLRLSRATG